MVDQVNRLVEDVVVVVVVVAIDTETEEPDGHKVLVHIDSHSQQD